MRATLSLLIVAAGDFSTLRLNGKPPISTQVELCGNLACDVFAVWDFTDEVRALAAQGGGELPLRIDPIAPLVRQSPSGSFSFALVAFYPAVNYPWAQGDLLNSFIIRFGGASLYAAQASGHAPIRPASTPPAPWHHVHRCGQECSHQVQHRGPGLRARKALDQRGGEV